MLKKSFQWNVANTFQLKVLGAQPTNIKACKWSYWWMPCRTNKSETSFGQALPFQSFHSTKLPILWFSPAASECLPRYPANGLPVRAPGGDKNWPAGAPPDPYAFPATWGTQRSNSRNLPLFGTAFTSQLITYGNVVILGWFLPGFYHIFGFEIATSQRPLGPLGVNCQRKNGINRQWCSSWLCFTIKRTLIRSGVLKNFERPDVSPWNFMVSQRSVNWLRGVEWKGNSGFHQWIWPGPAGYHFLQLWNLITVFDSSSATTKVKMGPRQINPNIMRC